MQITDINDMISTAAQLLNAPDLILIAVLLANVWLGARRGLVGALYGVLGRIGMIAASVAAELDATGAEVIVTACPLCKKALGRGTKGEIRDLAEIVATNIH